MCAWLVAPSWSETGYTGRGYPPSPLSPVFLCGMGRRYAAVVAMMSRSRSSARHRGGCASAPARCAAPEAAVATAYRGWPVVPGIARTGATSPRRSRRAAGELSAGNVQHRSSPHRATCHCRADEQSHNCDKPAMGAGGRQAQHCVLAPERLRNGRFTAFWPQHAVAWWLRSVDARALEQSSGARAVLAEPVVGVGQPAAVNRQAAASNAVSEVVAELLEMVDPLV
jgi:hypothetical protein